MDETLYPSKQKLEFFKLWIGGNDAGFWCHYEFHLINVGYLLDNYFIRLISENTQDITFSVSEFNADLITSETGATSLARGKELRSDYNVTDVEDIPIARTKDSATSQHRILYLDVVSLTNQFTSFDFSLGNTNDYKGPAYNTSEPVKPQKKPIVVDPNSKFTKEQTIAVVCGAIAGVVQVVFGIFIFTTFMKNRRTYTKAARKSKKI